MEGPLDFEHETVEQMKLLQQSLVHGIAILENDEGESASGKNDCFLHREKEGMDKGRNG